MEQLRQYQRRYDKAKTIAQQWTSLLEAAYHYCIPGRNMFYRTKQSQGEQKNIQVYDTTQVSATKNFVSKIHGALTPPQQSWAYLEASDNVPDEVKHDLNQQLQKYTDVIFHYIRSSNFDIAINECYYDLAVGTAILVCNEGESEEDPIKFSSIPLEQVAIEESIDHMCETCFRTWGETRIADIPHIWPKARLSSQMADALRLDPNAVTKNLVEAVIYNYKDKKTPYTYVLWHENDILLEEKQESSAFIIFRWAKINKEVFGRGPIIDALPSIMSLQTAAYFEMTAANLNICKPYMAYNDGILNPFTFKLQPNTIIPVSPNHNGQFPIQPLPDVANPQFMQITTMDLRQQINQLMFANPLGPVNDTPTRTATELSLRQRNLAEEIGPLFTRLQQEFLNKTIDRIRYILVKKGLLPNKIKIKGQEVKVKYKSPLTISQGQQDVTTFMNYMQVMQGIIGPEMSVAYLNNTKFPVWLAEKLGVDATLVNSEEQMQEIFQQKQDEMQEAQAMEMMQGMQQGAPVG